MIDVVRPLEAPPGLAARGHKSPDVLEALHRVFLGKCYLCETKVAIGTFEVDHRRPKAEGQFPELAREWSNLFPTCNTHRCNQRRERKYPEGGLLDPAGGDGVEVRIAQRIEGVVSGVLAQGEEGSRFVFAATSAEDRAASNTARELDRVHNGAGSGELAQFTAVALREAIVKQVLLVARLTRQRERISAADVGEREAIDGKLRVLLSRRAPYAMLVRSYFAQQPPLRALFD